MREWTFEAGALPLRVVSGPSAGAPVVLLHGVTRCGLDFLPIVPALAAHWEVHAVDLRGHGRSGRADDGAYRVVDYVPDIVDLLRDGVDGPAIVLGHSLGAMVAAAAAAEVPERVRALVLEDPTFAMTGERIGETGFPDLFRAFRAVAGSERPIAEVAATLADSLVRVPGGSGPVRLGTLRDGASLRFSAACLRRLDPAVLDRPLAGRWLDGYDVAATLARVACPTLLLQGDFAAGGALPDAYAAELAALLRDVVPIKLPGVGHNIHSTAAEAMLRLVLPFLAAWE